MIKKSILFSLIIISAALVSFTTKTILHVDTYKVDTAKSKVEWFAEKVTGKHNGTIAIQSGEFYNNHGKFGGKFTMEMNSIEVTDLSGEMKGKLEGHLKSEDFFSVKNFATSTFEITGLTPLSGVTANGPNFNVAGKLTIKGITNDLTFPALIRFDGGTMTASGEARVDRTKYNIRYRSKTFVEDIGDKAINDEFQFKFNITATM